MVSSTIAPCLESIRGSRSSVTAEKDHDKVRITIVANDTTAFRAAMNSAVQLLMVQEKMQDINLAK